MGKRHLTKPSTWLLMILIALPSSAAVLFTPALPEIAQEFSLSPRKVQLTMFTFLIGYLLAQLIYAPMSECIGRKKSLLVGISIATIASVLCAISSFMDFDTLLFGRFLLALGTGSGIILTFSILSDAFNEEDKRKRLSIMPIAFALFPSLSLLIGGVLSDFLLWPSTFYFLVGFLLLVFFIVLTMPETIAFTDDYALKPKRVFSTYLKLLKNRNLVLYSLLMGAGVSLYYIFSMLAPFVSRTEAQLTPTEYGMFSLLRGVGYFVGSVISLRLARHLHAKSALLVGLIVVGCSILSMFFFFLLDWINAWTLFLPAMILFLGQAIVFGNTSSLALLGVNDKTAGNSLFSFLFLLVATFSALFSSLCCGFNSIELPLFLLGFYAFMLVIYIVVGKRKEA